MSLLDNWERGIGEGQRLYRRVDGDGLSVGEWRDQKGRVADIVDVFGS